MYNTSDWGWYNHSFFVPYKPLRGGKVDEDNLKVIRVGKECDIKDLALEIRTNLLDNEYAIVQAMSKEAVNNAVKAIAIASRDEASKRGKNIISEIYFADVRVAEKDMTAKRFKLRYEFL